MNRLQGKGIYLMDEPEAALSPLRQLSMLTEFQKEMCQFRNETGKRFDTLEKLVIQNGEKLDNHRDYSGKKMTFMEHKSYELEQRIFELENRYD